jgi:hypothetical protein
LIGVSIALLPTFSFRRCCLPVAISLGVTAAVLPSASSDFELRLAQLWRWRFLVGRVQALGETRYEFGLDGSLLLFKSLG